MYEYIGKLFVAFISLKLIYSLLKGLYGSFLAEALGLNAKLKNLGEWAVVTGSTDGIGKAYAFEMARKGLNVVLISRTPYKLQNVAAEIKNKYNVEVKIIDVDFTNTNIYDRIQEEIKDLDVGVLINNVGISYKMPEPLTDVDGKLIQDMLNCNIYSMSMMSKIVLPRMTEKKKGMIINVSSLSSLIPAPFLTIYSASKAFVTNFSQSLSLELKTSGVQVQCVFPGYVVTNMSKIRRASLMIPTATAYVRSALATTGVETMSAGYYMHKIQVYAIELIGNYFPSYILEKIAYDSLLAVRKKCLKKMAASAKEQ